MDETALFYSDFLNFDNILQSGENAIKMKASEDTIWIAQKGIPAKKCAKNGILKTSEKYADVIIPNISEPITPKIAYTYAFFAPKRFTIIPDSARSGQ